MNSLVIADFLLKILGETPDTYSPANKWPGAIALLVIYAIPVIFVFLLLTPFIWIWRKKKGWTLKNITLAIASSIILVLLGLVALFFLVSLAQGLVFLKLYG